MAFFERPHVTFQKKIIYGIKMDISVQYFQDKAGYTDDFGDSDNEGEPDAYLARVKAEGKARDSDDEDDGSNSDESSDDDFNPDAGKLISLCPILIVANVPFNKNHI